MNLASVDGTIGPAAEARRSPPPTRACCAATASSRSCACTRGGRSRSTTHLARFGTLGQQPAPGRRHRGRARRARTRCSRRPARSTPCCGSSLTRGGHRLAADRAAARHLPAIRLGYVTYAPPRILDGIKSLSYAGNMLATRLAKERGLRRGAAGHAARPRARGADLVAVLGRAAASCSRRRSDDHILDSITRRAVMEAAPARGVPCPREELEAADEAFLASTVREVQPVVAVEDVELTAGPLTAAAATGAAGADRRRPGAPTPPSRAGGRREDRPGS